MLPGLEYDSASGTYVSEKHRRIAEIIHDYNPELSLAWIPYAERNENDLAPFAIIHTPSDGKKPYMVMYIQEEEMDERVLARLWSADASKSDPYAYLYALENAKEAMKLKEQAEELEERHDQAKFMLSTPLNTIKHNGKKIRLK